MVLLNCRLVKGDGEIVEEIVSKDRQKAINKVYISKNCVHFLTFFSIYLCSKQQWEMLCHSNKVLENSSNFFTRLDVQLQELRNVTYQLL